MEEQPELPDQPDILFVTVLVEGGMGLLALAIGWWRESSPWGLIRWSGADAAWAMLATLPPVIIGWLAYQFPIGPLRRLRRTMRMLTRTIFAGAQVWHLAFVSAWAGVGEELMFRGVLQPLAAQYIGTWWGLLIGSLLFALAHPLSWTYLLFTFLMGLYLGWMWLLFEQNLLVPILIHGLYDFAILLILTHRQRKGAANLI